MTIILLLRCKPVRALKVNQFDWGECGAIPPLSEQNAISGGKYLELLKGIKVEIMRNEDRI